MVGNDKKKGHESAGAPVAVRYLPINIPAESFTSTEFREIG